MALLGSLAMLAMGMGCQVSWGEDKDATAPVPDAASDTATPTIDASADVPTVPIDVATEAAVDAGTDASSDAPHDLSPDVAADVLADAAPEAAVDVPADGCSNGNCVCTASPAVPFVDDADSHGPMVRIVSNGNGYGVAWTAPADDAGAPEIFFRLLDKDGTPMGPATRVTNAPGLSLSPSLVWTGTHYGLAWHDGRDEEPDAAPGTGVAEIYFARLDANGEKIGSDVRVSNATGQSFRPSLVWTGTEYAVTWNDDRDGNHEIYFARLDASGAPVGGEMRVSNAAGTSLLSDLAVVKGAAGSNGYGVVWLDDRDGNVEVYFSRLDPSGVTAGTLRLTSTPLGSGDAHIAWNGTGFGVTWIEEKPGSAGASSQVVFAQVSEAGAKVGADVIVRDADGRAAIPILAWNGAEYGLAWRDTRSRGARGQIYFARLSTEGATIAGERSLTMGVLDASGLWLVADGARYAVAYHGSLDGSVAAKYFLRVCP